MKKCIKCGSNLPDDAVFCKECGTAQPEKKSSSKKLILIISVIAAIAIITGLVFFFSGNKEGTKPSDKQSVEKTADAKDKNEKGKEEKNNEKSEVEFVKLPAEVENQMPDDEIMKTFEKNTSINGESPDAAKLYDITGDGTPELIERYTDYEGFPLYFVFDATKVNNGFAELIMKMEGKKNEELFTYKNKLYALYTTPEDQSIYLLEVDPDGFDGSIKSTHVATSSPEPGKTNVFKLAEIPVDKVANLGL